LKIPIPFKVRSKEKLLVRVNLCNSIFCGTYRIAVLARPWLMKVTERAGTGNLYCMKYGQFRGRFEGQCGMFSFGGRLEE
jgi:hypothetical protein